MIVPVSRGILVYAWCGGNGYGRVSVDRESIAFRPGPLSRLVLRLDGSLVHRSRKVVSGCGLVGVGTMFCLEATELDERLRQRPLLGRHRQRTWVNVSPLVPGGARRMRRKLQDSGYDVQHVRRLLAPWSLLRPPQ